MPRVKTPPWNLLWRFRATALVMVLVTLAVMPAEAQTIKADEVASCNASFHLTCVSTDGTITSGSSAAPIGDLGDGPLEIMLLLLLGGGLVATFRRTRRTL